MEQNEKLDLLEYKVRLIHSIITSMDDFKHDFFSFIIDHNLTESQTSLILKALSILKDRIDDGEVLEITRSLYSGIEELRILMINNKPSFKEFQDFIRLKVDEDINTEYLLKSLQRQKINVKVCEFLLEDCKNKS
ncbi:hypothetical protein [Clostridium hydrogeniformans]|uniref:hypothetical protein n=1 Tax=Clostridium hydrogeniformans TaxID=349933 RepID=UPI000480900E|nr:hypothetical protein [Clostridium hydrogeniformans]